MKFVFTFVIISCISIFPQLFNRDAKELFKRIQLEKTNQPNDSIFNYPLHDGDFIEYVQQDTAVFMGYGQLYYTVIKEVIKDTLMINGLTYKIIKAYKASNANLEAPVYEFMRKEANKVFIYKDGKDVVLYDFNKIRGEFYLTFNNYQCKVEDIYFVNGFGKRLKAYDFEIRSSTSVRRETIVEEFGIITYMGDLNLYTNLPEGSFYGAKINDTLYNYPLAKDQPIDWNEYYPLQTGDYWVYNDNYNSFISTTTARVIGDTIMSDGNTYKVIINEEEIGGPHESKNIKYEKFESPYLYEWDPYESIKLLKLKFTSVIGDTFKTHYNRAIRLNDKSTELLEFMEYPDMIYSKDYYEKGIGLNKSTSYGGSKIIQGAFINGILYGDTTVLGIKEEIQNLPNEFYLAQNYPNPFNPSTQIRYTIKEISNVELKVFDILGREAITLVNEMKEPGEYISSFNGTDLSSGIYLYKLTVGEYTAIHKMILMK